MTMITALDLLVRSSIVLGAGLALAAALRNRSAALRHWVLALSIAGAAIVPALSLVIPDWALPLPAIASGGGAAAEPPAASSLSSPPIEARGTTVRAERRVAGVGLGWLALAVWATGSAALLLVLLTGLLRLAWLERRARRLRRGRWPQLAREVAAACGVRRAVALLETDSAEGLATWGLFRPRVLLPAAATGWTDERCRAVLWHELAHVRRHDWIVQLVADAVRALNWFNPLCWLACSRLRRESEHACDDRVLAAGMPAPDYAGHLLDVARMGRHRPAAWAVVVPMATPSMLERRIATMLDPRLDRRALSSRSMLTTAALLGILAAAAASVGARQAAPLPLTGTVYDASGALLPDVVVALQGATQARAETRSDSAGRFTFPNVAPGRYVIEAKQAGFKSLRQEIELKNVRDWDRTVFLQVGSLRETVEIRATRSAPTQPTAGPTTPTRLRVGGNVRAPRRTVAVNPEYPESMRTAGLEATVPLEAVVDRDGAVVSVRVLSSQVHPDFAVAAVDAVRQWRYEPTLLNGVPVEVAIEVTLNFSLEP